MDTLDIEAGVARPWRDFVPARDASSACPTPDELGLQSLIDEGHQAFNGRRSWSAHKQKKTSQRMLAGVAVDGVRPVPFAPLVKDGRKVGRTLSSRYSPSLRRAIALAELEAAYAEPGTTMTVAEPGTLARTDLACLAARVAILPFLPGPDSIMP